MTHPTGPVVSWSSSHGVRAEPASPQVIRRGSGPLIRYTAVVLWVSSEIRAFWGSISRMICGSKTRESGVLASMKLDSWVQSGGTTPAEGPDVKTGRMTGTRALRCSPGPPDTAKIPRKASGATILLWVAGHADRCQPRVPSKLRIDIVAGQRPTTTIVVL